MYLSIILISFASFAFSEPIVESIDCRDAIALAGQDLMVNLTLQSKAQYVYIQYQINYGPSLNTSMAAGESNRFRAIIPASSFKVGDMVRWKFFVDDQGHMWTFDYSSGNSSSWCGTCIQDNSPLSKIPTLAWWTPNGSESLTVAGADGGSLCFGGRFYDNVSTKRRGVTSLSFKKPKLSFKVDGGGFEFLKGRMNVKSFDLSNLFFELGEKSMMKEMVALDFLQLAGVVSSISYYVQVVRNGQWFGLWGMLEVVDAVFLEQRGIDPSGPLFKSSAAEESNLRFDIPTDQLHFYYNKENRKSHPEDWDLLNNLTFSLAGGGPLTRSNFLLQGLDLPSIINQMAAQTLVLNMDRCTKNFFVHLDNSSSRWRMIPWDLDASFGQDNGFGGSSGPNFAVLAEPQWNHPDYCDIHHYQDMRTKTPWGWVTVNLNSYQGPAVKGRTLMAVVDERDPNENETNRPSISGVLGTYNHLIDSIIRVDSTRQMYYRRLQTLVDDYLMSGRLEALVSSTYDRIKDLAVKDAKLWETGIDPEKGMLQITTEFLPTRLQQMTLLYGPNGSQPILPGPQSASAALSLVVKRDPPYLVLTNPLVEAVDLSGWQLNASASAAKEVQVFAFPPGTVIPAMQDLILAPEGTNTRLETGKFILGPLAADLDDLGSLPVGAFKLLRGPG